MILKHLRLGGLLAHWDELLAEARRGRFSHERLLETRAGGRIPRQEEHARLLRRKRASIPEMLEIETFPFARQPKLDRKKIMSLYDGFDYVTKRQNIVWLGPTGCGKSGLATAFLLQALDRGYRGCFITFPELIAELYASLADRSEQQVLRKYAGLRLPAHRRVGVCRGRARPGRAVFYADAKATQDQDHADYLESGLQRMGIAAEERPTNRRPAQPADGDQPCDQHERLPQLAAQAGRGRRKRHGMSFAELRRRAAVVRAAPLESVLLLRGAVRDGADRHKWHTERGPLSVTGPKFTNWHTNQGGGGAIDLVMHLANVDFRVALAWLEGHLAAGLLAVGEPGLGDSLAQSASSQASGLADPAPGSTCLGRVPAARAPCTPGRLWSAGEWRPPLRDDRLLGGVRRYLAERRHLAASVIEPLIESDKVYADGRGNAVFVLVAGKTNRPVGAELRGTGPRVWRGMAAGSRKDHGYFWVGLAGSRQIVLCESAIDALSCFQMDPQRICISTSGVRADPPWLRGLLARDYELYCGFDADQPGDAAAVRMIALHAAVKRLRPPGHDWNDVLASRR